MVAVSQTVEWERVVEGARVRFMSGERTDPATADNIDAHV
jgi:hypothetical protein